MTLSDEIWLDSVAARNNLMAAANYTAAFYGNAAVQSLSLGLSAPQVFWSAMARAFDDRADNDGVSLAPDAPLLSLVEAAPVPAVAEAATNPAPVAEATDSAAAPNPHLLDAPRGGVADDLKRVKGIGAKLEAGLNALGIYHFDQIARLDAEGINWLDTHLPGFKRSCVRFDLVKGADEFV